MQDVLKPTQTDTNQHKPTQTNTNQHKPTQTNTNRTATPPKFWYTRIAFLTEIQAKHVKRLNVKWSRYRPAVAQRLGRVIALLFHDCGTRRGWVGSSTSRPQFTPGKDPVPVVQEAGWVPGPIWMGGKSRPHRDSSRTFQTIAQSL